MKVILSLILVFSAMKANAGQSVEWTPSYTRAVLNDIAAKNQTDILKKALTPEKVEAIQWYAAQDDDIVTAKGLPKEYLESQPTYFASDKETEKQFDLTKNMLASSVIIIRDNNIKIETKEVIEALKSLFGSPAAAAVLAPPIGDDYFDVANSQSPMM